jgi:lysophospholipase L1-like esterase
VSASLSQRAANCASETYGDELTQPKGTTQETTMARQRKHRPDVTTWNDIDSDSGFPSFPGQRFLAEGDSWFSMSGAPPYNLLFELRFREITQIVNCAFPGDTIVNMSKLVHNKNYREALTTPGFKWKAIFLSGGGNDLIDRVDEILIPKSRRNSAASAPADFCDRTQLRDLVGDVQRGFRSLASLRDSAGSNSKKAPIVTHTYDYATPRNAPARFFFFKLGPWLYPALKSAKVPESAWIPVADYLIDELAEGLLALQKGSNRIKNFYVVNTRGAAARADPGDTGSSHDWQNEIHPSNKGYRKLARRVEKKLDKIFG